MLSISATHRPPWVFLKRPLRSRYLPTPAKTIIELSTDPISNYCRVPPAARSGGRTNELHKIVLSSRLGKNGESAAAWLNWIVQKMKWQRGFLFGNCECFFSDLVAASQRCLIFARIFCNRSPIEEC